jgi:hypothetical protein
MHVWSNPRDRYPNDAKHARLSLMGLSAFAVAAVALMLYAVFSPLACS